MGEGIIPMGEPVTRIALTDMNREDLVQLGALRWPEDKIAAFFGWDRKALKFEIDNPESEISRLLLRGELEADFKLEARLMSDAQEGNLTAAKQFSELMRDRSFRMSKLDLFGGAEKGELFEAIQKYLDKGCAGNLSTREQMYLEMLQIIYSFNNKLGDRRTLRLLTQEPYKMEYNRARDMMAEAVELFNGGRRATKEAMRYHAAETYDNLYHMILDTAKTPQDIALAGTMHDKKVKLLRLDEPDPNILPPEQYMKTFRVLSLTTECLGLPAVNRDEVAAQIDALEIPDAEKKRIRMEAGVEDMDIVKMMEDVTSQG